MIDVKIDIPEIDDIKSRLKGFESRSNTVLNRAINRTAKHAMTNIAKESNLKYLIKQKTVRDTLKVKNARGKNSQAQITSKGSAIPLINFDVSPIRQVKLLKSGKYSPNMYSSRVLRGSARKGVERMFVAKNQALVRPENVSRAENKKITNWLRLALSVPQMIGNKEVIARIKENTADKLKQRIEHEIEFELRRLQN